jgi:HlyD family secretion protein
MPISLRLRRSGIVLAVVLGSSGVTGAAPAAAESKPGDLTVAPRVLKLHGTLVGRLGAEADELQLRFKAYAGKMTVRTVVPAGTAVKRGDVVLALETEPGDEAVRDAELAAEGARLAVEAARLELAGLEFQHRAELEKAQIRARRAAEEKRLDVDQRWPLEMKDNELAVRRFEASISDQEKELAELEKMYKASELASDTKEIVIDRARRELAITRDSLEQTRKRIRLAVETDHPRRILDLANETQWSGDDLDQLKKRQPVALAKAKNGLGQAEAALEKARDLAAKLREDRKAFDLTAPRDGVLVHGSAHARWNAGKGTAAPPEEDLEAGDPVQARQVLLTVLASGPGPVLVRVPESMRLRVKAGTPAEARFAALPGQAFAGKVAEIAELPDGAEGAEKTCSARVALAAPDAALRPGLTASVELDLGEIVDALVIPNEAVLQKAGRSYCRVRVGEKVEERRIVLGRWDGVDVHVVSGLQAGDVVVLKP